MTSRAQAEGAPVAIELQRLPLRRLRVDEYHRMIEAGILHEDERAQLLGGLIVAMAPQTERHALAIQRLNRTLVRGLSDEFVVRPQLPLTLSEDDEPEPDLAVVRAADARSKDEHPRSAVLVIEVAVDSLRLDRKLKGPTYARAGIPEYWILNLRDGCVEVYGDPDLAAGRYRSRIDLHRGQHLTSRLLSGLSIAVAELLD